MATRFVTNIDLVQNQILNGRFESVSSDPNTNLFDGRLIFNTTEGVVKVYDITAAAWRKIITSIDSTGTNAGAIDVNESNGEVTIAISDATTSASGFMSASDKSKLDGASSSDSTSTLVIRDAAGRFQASAPSADLDVANKAYVDSARAGLDVKQSVKVATTGPITLSTGLEAGDQIDGYTLVAGDRVLVKDQDTASENGIYVVASSGAPSRATDADSNAEVTAGLFTFVERGDLNGDSGWVLITDSPINVGSTGLEFSLFSVAGNILAGDGLEKTGDVLSVNVDSTTIEINSDTLRLAASAAGDGLSGGGGSALSVNVAAAGGIEIVSDDLQIKVDSNFVGLATTADGLKINSDIVGAANVGGLAYTDGEISISLRASNPGLTFGDGMYPGLAINLGTNSGLSLAGGLKVDSSIAGVGLTLTDGVLDITEVNLATGSYITGVLPVVNGGTGSDDEVAARHTLAVNPTAGTNGTTAGSGQSEGYNVALARIMAKTIGNGVALYYDIKHDFETLDVIVQVFETATGETVIADIARTGINTVRVSFSSAPGVGAYRVVVTGANPS